MVIALIPIAILAALTDLTASFFIRLAVVQNFLTVFSIAFVQEFLIFPDSFIFELNQLYLHPDEDFPDFFFSDEPLLDTTFVIVFFAF